MASSKSKPRPRVFEAKAKATKFCSRGVLEVEASPRGPHPWWHHIKSRFMWYNTIFVYSGLTKHKRFWQVLLINKHVMLCCVMYTVYQLLNYAVYTVTKHTNVSSARVANNSWTFLLYRDSQSHNHVSKLKPWRSSKNRLNRRCLKKLFKVKFWKIKNSGITLFISAKRKPQTVHPPPSVVMSQ